MAFCNNYPLGTVQKSFRNAQFPVSPWLISPSQVLKHLCVTQGTMRLEILDKQEETLEAWPWTPSAQC